MVKSGFIGSTLALFGLFSRKSEASIENWTKMEPQAPIGSIKSKEWISIPADSLSPSEALYAFAFTYLWKNDHNVSVDKINEFILMNDLDPPRNNWAKNIKYTKSKSFY